jgi:hypothetical protein
VQELQSIGFPNFQDTQKQGWKKPNFSPLENQVFGFNE